MRHLQGIIHDLVKNHVNGGKYLNRDLVFSGGWSTHCGQHYITNCICNLPNK